MAINAEDAMAIVSALRDNLQRLGLGALHDDVLLRIAEDDVGANEHQMREPEYYLGSYVNNLMWLLNSYNPGLARGTLQRLREVVSGRIEGVVVDLGPNPVTGEPTVVPLEAIVPDYSLLAGDLREVLAPLELRYHEPVSAEPDASDIDSKKEPPFR